MTIYEIIMASLAAASAIALIFQVRIAIIGLQADQDRRKKQATIEYIGTIWRDTRQKLEHEYGRSVMTAEQVQEIKEDHKLEANIRNLLGVLEHMSTGIHMGVYDKQLLYRMSATFIIQAYRRLKPYIEDQMQANPTMYIEFKNLAEEFEEWKASEIKGRSPGTHM